jgi:hypothetical protein
MPAPTLDGRLLCACKTTYAIVTNGPLEPSALAADYARYYAGAGFAQPPVALLGANNAINACLVGVIPDGVVLACRGTLQLDLHSYPSLEDWFSDFNADPRREDGYPSPVHSGFIDALNDVWNNGLVDTVKQAGPTAPFWITGHSKGGAMAALAAWYFQTVLTTPAKVVTFAAPRCSNRAFAQAYNAQIEHIRYEYGNDLVPHLPPAVADFLDVLSSLPFVGSRFAGFQRYDYESVGQLRYINQQLQISADSPLLMATRALGLANLVLFNRFTEIVADHAIACGSGYMSAVCPTGVCE